MNLRDVEIKNLSYRVLPLEEEIFPGKDAVILWNGFGGNGVKDVTVINSPIGSQNHITPEYEKLPASDGNICAGWMAGRDAATPGRIYGNMLGKGFDSHEEHLSALSQFARIKEADWARQMLIGMDNVRNYAPEDDE